MAQLQRPQSQKQPETSKSPPTIHTMEQLLRGESSKSKSPTCLSSSSTNSSSSPSSSPFFQRFRHHDSEEEHGQNQRKSVLTKVKEKAKKLRHSLSLSKRKNEDGNASSPSSATGLERDGVEEHDAEYLGAPMYESEKAPAGYKANTRQHSSPRANPVVPPEKLVISSSDKHVVEPDQEKTLNRSIRKTITTTKTKHATSPTSPNATTTTNILSGPNNTMTETVAQKPKPVHAEKPDAALITSKIQGLNLSKPSEHHDHTSSSSTVSPKTTRSTSLSYAAPLTSPTKVLSQDPSSTLRNSSDSLTPAPAATPPSVENTTPTAQTWDKGVSMKEYLLNKLEPGEDEKALSRVISEAMSPRRTPGDAGVMEKVREAVTSLLRNEEPPKYADITTTATATSTSPMSSQNQVSTNTSRASSQMSASTHTSRASSQIPLSFKAEQDYAVAQEENHGRILQAN